MAAYEEYIREQVALAGESNFTSQEAEESVLHCLILRDSARFRELNETDFYFPEHAKIFRAIKTAVAKQLKVDLVTIDAILSELYPKEANSLSQIMVGCIKGHFLSRNVDSYIRIVRELSSRRRSIRLVDEIASQLRNPVNETGYVLDQLRDEIYNISVSKHKWESMSDVMLATYEYLEKRAKGEEKSITTGITNVDELIGGFYGSELTVIGARPSVGKSAFAANIALAASKKGFKVGIASCEMSNVQLGQRMISHESFIDGMKLRKAELDPDDWCTIAECLSVLSTLPISFLFTAKTVEDLRSEVQQSVEKGEMDMLIVDYLQLMDSSQRFRDEYLRVGHVSKTLKRIATDFNIPVIALAQVNRDTDGMMPTLKSLRASGDIEQDADGVLFLHRPNGPDDPSIDKRDRDCFVTFKDKGYEYISIGVAKQRQGNIGTSCVLFDPAHMRYFAIDRSSGESGV